MASGPYIAEAAALIGDPARANMLAALMGGHAHTAAELAAAAGVTPQTASGHLAKLLEGRLVVAEPCGRYRHYRLAGPEVARALESLMVVAANGPPRHRPSLRQDAAMREARTCYDHLAGRLAVAVTDALLARGVLVREDRSFRLTPAGDVFLRGLGLPVDALRRRRRAFARCCIDWSERRPHLGGALGAALAEHALAAGWVVRLPGTRAVRITAAGRAAFDAILEIQADQAQAV